MLVVVPCFVLYSLFSRNKWRRLNDHFGLVSLSDATENTQKTIWFHALSLGEVVGVTPTIRLLKKNRPQDRIVVSVTTDSGFEAAKKKLSDVDEIYVPIGGGGLAAGILVAIKDKNPNVKVIGVESKSFPSMKKSLDSGKLETIEGGFTVADGISVRTPGEQTFEIIKDRIDEIVLVDDDEIINAMFLLMERSKSVVEPAGAAGLAYLVSKKPSPGKKVVPILCGGNIDMYLLGQIVAKGLATMGRMVKIFILLKDKPGALKEVVDELASLSANIVEVVHDRLSSNVRAGTTGVTLSLETEDQKHMDKLIQHLKEKNIDFKVLT